MRIITFLFFISSTILIQAQNAGKWYNMAVEESDLNKKIEYYSNAISKDPNYKEAFYNRGNINVSLKKYDEAKRDFDEAIRIDPNFKIAYFNRGLLNVSLKKYDEAKIDFDEAVRIDPNYSSAYNGRGVTYHLLKKYDEAKKDFDEAIRLTPNEPNSYLGRGNTNYALKEYDEAKRDYNEVIRLNPNNLDAYFNRGRINYLQEEFDEAIRDYNECVKLKPSFLQAFLLRSHAKSGRGDYEAAIVDLNEIIRLDPKNADALNARAWAKIPLQKYQEAITDANEAIRLNPNPYFYDTRGWANYYLGRYKDALIDFNEVIKLDAIKYNGYVGKALCNYRTNKYNDALNDINEANTLAPDNNAVLVSRGMIFVKLGKTEEAQNDLIKSRELARKINDKRSLWDYNLLAEELTKLLNSTVSSNAPITAASKTINQNLKKVALVIGVKSYTAVPPLTNTLNDAKDIAASLRTKGFEVIELLDPKTKSEMRNAAIKFSKALEDFPDGIGMLYYSGHGMQIDGANYLIPAAATLDVKADVQEQCMDMDYFLRIMESNGNHLNIVVLDACRNNPFRSFSRAADKGLSMVSAPKGSYIVYSTKPGSVASDGVGRNGLFTSKLLKYLNEPDLSIEQVFKRVAADVSTDSNDSQRPWIASDYTGEFYFNKRTGQ